jgi:transcriptional regulator with XRE-family HTH domain
MVPYQPSQIDGLSEMLRRFGTELRRCRQHRGFSQLELSYRSGVPQSTISRIERGLVPRAAMSKIVMMSHGLGRSFPLGYCPHDHRCAWGRLDANGRPTGTPSDAIDELMRLQGQENRRIPGG